MSRDFEKNPETAGPLFLTTDSWNSSEILPPLSLHEIIYYGYVYTPSTIRIALIEALNCLNTFPGPNLEFRRQHSEGWLGWWIEELSHYDQPDYYLMKTYNILDFDSIHENLIEKRIDDFRGRRIPTIWFVAGLEGHEGSRFAIEHVLRSNKIAPYIIFENETYMKGKERKNFFLPLELRLSMYSHYFRKRDNRVILSTNWYSSMPNKQQSEMYEYLFNQLHGYICLANADDPQDVLHSKMQRSQFFPTELLIPHLDVPSTTERVRI
jgi:hypothetical protein